MIWLGMQVSKFEMHRLVGELAEHPREDEGVFLEYMPEGTALGSVEVS